MAGDGFGAGVVTAYYNEFDPFAAKWLRELMDDGLIAPGHIDNRDIWDVTAQDLKGYTQCHFFAGIGIWSLALRLSGWPDDRPIWTGSCPCQSFSQAGKGLGFDDERHLWPAWHWLIANGKPDDVPVVGEQVASKAGRAWFDLVSSDMEALDHACGAVDTSAAGNGQRLYWLATANHQGSQGRLTEQRGQGADQRATGTDGMDVGLAETMRAGWPEGWAGTGNGSVASSSSGGLAASAGDGSQSQPNGRSAGVFGAVAESSQVRQSTGEHGTSMVDSPDPHGHSGIPLRPVDFWRYPDWLLCRDPDGARFRPVEPTHDIMVDAGAFCKYVAESSGASGEAAQAQEVDNEKLQTVRREVGAQDISAIGQDGGIAHSGSSPVLRQEVHGGLDARTNQGDERAEQQAPVVPNAWAGMRVVREASANDACSSHGSEPVQQRPEQSPDIVRFLPRSLALAQLRGEHRAANALLALRQAILQERSLLHAPDQVEKVWRSLDHATKARIAADHQFHRWERVSTFPLTRTGEYLNRLDEVRGAGNALNIGQAANFISAVMEYLDR